MATEEILLAHEMEKHRLLDEKATKEPVLMRLDKYFELLDEMSQLEVGLLFCCDCRHYTDTDFGLRSLLPTGQRKRSCSIDR